MEQLATKVSHFLDFLAFAVLFWSTIQTAGAFTAWIIYRNDAEIQQGVREGSQQPRRFGIPRRLMVMLIAALWITALVTELAGVKAK